MIPSHKWFPRNLVEQARWMRNFAAQIAIIGLSLGLSAEDIEIIVADAEAFSWLVANQAQIDSYERAARQYRKHVSQGKRNSSLSAFPQPPAATAPPGITPGIFERLDRYVRLIRVASKFTPEIAALLGIVPAKLAKVNLAAEKPDPSLRAITGNVVEVHFVRGTASGIAVQFQLDNSKDWQDGGRYRRSPAKLAIASGPDNLPRAVRVRARYLDGNDPVGQYSDVDTISTIP